MGKTRDLFKKIRDTKGTFHAKLGSIKDRNGMALTEAEDIKKRWQEYTELYKKDLHNPDNHDGVLFILGYLGSHFHSFCKEICYFIVNYIDLFSEFCNIHFISPLPTYHILQ